MRGIETDHLEFCYKFANQNGFICLSNKYSKLINWRCAKCGFEWSSNLRDELKKVNHCKRCYLKAFLDDAKSIAISKGGICHSTEYKNLRSKLCFECDLHHFWNPTLQSIKSGAWCPHCDKERVLREAFERRPAIVKKINDMLEAKGGGEVLVGFINWRTKLKIKCHCGNIFETMPSNLISDNHWCGKCALRNRTLSFEYAKNFIESRGGIVLSDGKDYIDGSSRIKIMCKKGHIWDPKFIYVHSSKRWCPDCNCFGKNVREKLLSVLKQIFYKYEVKTNQKIFPWLLSNKKRRMEVDFFITNEDKSFTLAIEYDGKQHYEPMRFTRGKNKNTKISKKMAVKELRERQQRDLLKNKLIAAHPEDIKYFLRIPYTESLSFDNVYAIVTEFLLSHSVYISPLLIPYRNFVEDKL